jgi:hypothetical protein
VRVERAVALAGLAAAILLPAAADASGLPACRVRLTTSGYAPSVSDQIVREVASFINAADRGCTLVPTITEADVLLEITHYSFVVSPDETPTHRWFFTARRLGEPDPSQAIQRFGLLMTGPVAQANERALNRLPSALTDICLGDGPFTSRRY